MYNICSPLCQESPNQTEKNHPPGHNLCWDSLLSSDAEINKINFFPKIFLKHQKQVLGQLATYLYLLDIKFCFAHIE